MRHPPSPGASTAQDSKAYQCYKCNKFIEDYYCSFGINPNFREQLNRPDLLITGVDQDNEIRIIEIPGNIFFIATLFVPHERRYATSYLVTDYIIRKYLEGVFEQIK
jgi:CTP synthase (UTP-ammonia lyase)